MLGPFGESAILGIVQGVTEFLPLSSDGHLALADVLFKLHASAGYGVLLRGSALVAILVVLRAELTRALAETFGGVARPSRFRLTPGVRDALVVLGASVPTAVVALALRQPVERWTESPLAIGLGFLGTTAALVLAHFSAPGDRDHPSVAGALLLGAAQGLSVLPGLSRSGATIAIALWLGVRKRRAFELSMLIAVPALAGAILLEAHDGLAAGWPGGPALLGALIATLTGILALRALRDLVERGLFGWFAFWVGPLALATIAMGLAWPR